MRSKQINFFMMPEDVETFEAYLKGRKDTEFLGLPMYKQELRIVKSLLDKGKDMFFGLFLASNFLLDKIVLKYIPKQDYYLIEDLTSPVIEFDRCFYDFKNKKIRRGRLYVITGYYADNGEWVMKEQRFLDWADEIFKWFRKTFRKQKLEGYEGFLVTPKTIKWVQEEGGDLLKL